MDHPVRMSVLQWLTGRGNENEPCTQVASGEQTRRRDVLYDILVALLITAVAVVLRITVQPVVFLVVILAVAYLFTKHAGNGRHVL